MTDIKLDRTFWPVGHGAFYTERFYNHENENIFTAIYDCGNGRRWGKTQNGKNDASPKTVQRMINGFFPPRKDQNGNVIRDIDIAFVSHLHVDHINGLPTILPRIKKLVLPQMTKCRLLEAFLYNSIPEDVRSGEISVAEIDDGRQADTEGEVQTFILRLARGEVENIVQVSHDEGATDWSFELENLNGGKGSVSAIRVPLSPEYNAYWIYQLVDVDTCSEDIHQNIIKELQPHVATGNIVINAEGEIDWNKIAEAVRRAGLKAVIAIYEKVFGIKVSSQHNSYSMPVYSGPEDSVANHYIFAHTDIYMNGLDVHRYMHCRYDVFPHPFRSVRLPLGLQCKLLSCLYMGDFNTKDDEKFLQLQNILGVYYDRVGIQQVPHHFSDGNHCAELYRGSLFAFGNVSSYHDKSFKKEVFDDIVRFGCDPLVITQNIHTMVKFEYRLDIY